MNKKLLNTLLLCSITLASCGGTDNSVSPSVSDNNQSEVASENSESITDSNASEALSEEEKDNGNYVEITDVNQYFETYETDDDYNYVVDYKYETIKGREYYGGLQTEYIYDGKNVQISYEYDGIYYVDYLIADEKTGKMTYYLDNGTQQKYQYLTEDNEYFFGYYSNIDRFELADIDWEDDFVFDLENKKCKPVNEEAKDRICKQIFGDNSNEFWHSLTISWNDGGICNVDAVSIYNDIVFYFDINISDNGYAIVDISDINAIEYIDPSQPFYRGRETYTGVALTEAQAAALTIFEKEEDLNYTSSNKWTLVNEGEIVESQFITTQMKTVNGNYEYTYKDSATQLELVDYLISNEASYAPTYYLNSVEGGYSVYAYGMDNYSSYVSNIYFDRVRLYGLDASDFIYDADKGYITAKDLKTEEKYIDQLFQYGENYGGLRIYLSENEDNTFVISKIVTSAYVAYSDGTSSSVVKEYVFSNLGTTVITYPDSIALS